MAEPSPPSRNTITEYKLVVKVRTAEEGVGKTERTYLRVTPAALQAT